MGTGRRLTERGTKRGQRGEMFGQTGEGQTDRQGVEEKLGRMGKTWERCVRTHTHTQWKDRDTRRRRDGQMD